MNINNLYSVIWKELKEIKYGKKTIVGFITLIAILLTIVLLFRGKQILYISFTQDIQGFAISVIVYAQLFIMIAISHIFITQIFYNERIEKNLEPLLCTPLNITIVWLGKVIAIFIVALLWSTTITISIVIIFRLFLLPTIYFSIPVLIQIIIISPLLLAVLIELVGFLLLVFRNIQIAKFFSLFIYILLGVLSGNLIRNITSRSLEISWKSIVLFLIISLVLIVAIAYCTKFLRKERIV